MRHRNATNVGAKFFQFVTCHLEQPASKWDLCLAKKPSLISSCNVKFVDWRSAPPKAHAVHSQPAAAGSWIVARVLPVFGSYRRTCPLPKHATHSIPSVSITIPSANGSEKQSPSGKMYPVLTTTAHRLEVRRSTASTPGSPLKSNASIVLSLLMLST